MVKASRLSKFEINENERFGFKVNEHAYIVEALGLDSLRFAYVLATTINGPGGRAALKKLAFLKVLNCFHAFSLS
jgi:hypothetical protein